MTDLTPAVAAPVPGVAAAAETVRIAVDVTFMAQLSGRFAAPVALPTDCRVVRVLRPSVAFYRFLYDTVGREYCWWLRRVTPDAELRALLADPRIEIHVLYQDGAPAGFFELDRRESQFHNIAYFGLMPEAIGRGLGRALLHRAIAEAERGNETGMVRVNTCTADHSRALPNYLAAGFRTVRTLREVWNIPTRLGLPIPDRLRS